MKSLEAKTGLDAIERRLAPPAALTPLGVVDLELMRSLLQSDVPPDYLAFLARYGGGAIPGLLRVLDPGAEDPLGHPVRQLLVQLDAMNTTRLLVGWKWGQAAGPGEFVPWGIGENGTILYFRSVGAPEKWTVTLGPSGAAPKHLRALPLTMTSFLAELLAGTLAVPELPSLPASLAWVPSARAKPTVASGKRGAR